LSASGSRPRSGRRSWPRWRSTPARSAARPGRGSSAPRPRGSPGAQPWPHRRSRSAMAVRQGAMSRGRTRGSCALRISSTVAASRSAAWVDAQPWLVSRALGRDGSHRPSWNVVDEGADRPLRQAQRRAIEVGPPGRERDARDRTMITPFARRQPRLRCAASSRSGRPPRSHRQLVEAGCQSLRPISHPR
jgi:hypothetical protein